MTVIDITVDEAISTINKSSLPTVLIEGNFDLLAYDELQNIYADMGLSLMPLGGRTKVLDLFNRRTELLNSKMVVFIADKDLFVLDGVPQEFCDDKLVFTSGYSIENDLFIDGELEKILSNHEKTSYRKDLDILLGWYTLAIMRNIAGNNQKIDYHADHILTNESSFCKLETGEIISKELDDEIRKNYQKLLRGKTLLGVLMRHLSYKGRPVRHRADSLLEMVVKSNNHALLDKIFAGVAVALEV